MLLNGDIVNRVAVVGSSAARDANCSTNTANARKQGTDTTEYTTSGTFFIN